MHQSEIDRLRKAIRRSYGSSPHKKKYWLALLEDHAGALRGPNPFKADESGSEAVGSDGVEGALADAQMEAGGVDGSGRLVAEGRLERVGPHRAAAAAAGAPAVMSAPVPPGATRARAAKPRAHPALTSLGSVVRAPRSK